MMSQAISVCLLDSFSVTTVTRGHVYINLLEKIKLYFPYLAEGFATYNSNGKKNKK